jgi:hypothetical protein
MSSHGGGAQAQHGGFQGQIPPVEPLLLEVVATLSLAAHEYLSESDGREADRSSAEIVIDVATAAFERVKERLRAEERLAITQMLTETRLAFVRKRGI